MSVDYTFLCDKNIFFFFLYTTTLTPTLSSELYPGSYFILFRQRGGGGLSIQWVEARTFYIFLYNNYIFSFFSSYYIICFYMKHLKPSFSGEFVFLIEGTFLSHQNEQSTKYTYRLCMCTLYLQTTTRGALSFLKYIFSYTNGKLKLSINF